MKYTTVLFSLMAVATAASMSDPNTDIPNIAARHRGHGKFQQNSTREGYDREGYEGLEKRRRYRSRYNSSGNRTSDAALLMNMNLGILVAGLGAGVGAAIL